MLNMDMVGRVDTTKNAISIMGSGTSPQWDSLLNLQTTPFDLVKSASGVGPSDYTSFYLKDIPALGFFTGTHSDYHKPGDDSETLNYEGMMQVYQLIFNIVSDLNDFETIAFSKTVDSNARSAPSFTVTLGIIPDYVYEGKGLKIDGVTEGKPGAVAGLQKGDIITRMGELSIDDIYAYMNALSKFKQGEEIEIEILREGIQTVLKTTL
jgi:C-terminal processing protease CtpA/Prc